MAQQSKHAPGPFDFCPKHKGSFYQSCGCPWKKNKKEDKEEGEPIKENE